MVGVDSELDSNDASLRVSGDDLSTVIVFAAAQVSVAVYHVAAHTGAPDVARLERIVHGPTGTARGTLLRPLARPRRGGLVPRREVRPEVGLIVRVDGVGGEAASAAGYSALRGFGHAAVSVGAGELRRESCEQRERGENGRLAHGFHGVISVDEKKRLQNRDR